MSYQPYLGPGGIVGWAMLARSAARQRHLVANDGDIKASTEYFRDRIPAVRTADDLVSDYRLLKTALGAFGLEGDLANKAFIRKVLESDLSDDLSLANRLADKSYRRLAEAFSFAEPAQQGTGFVRAPQFADGIVARYVEREFESRVGQQNQEFRLALNARRELAGLAASSSSNSTRWYEILGNIPLRRVFEGAFGFGSEYGRLPIDRQLLEFTDAAERVLGSSDLAQLENPGKMEKLIRIFLARNSVTAAPVTNRFSVALTLLSNG